MALQPPDIEVAETLIESHNQIEMLKADQTIAQHIAETLHRSYPGHLWAVKASVEQGVVYIHNLNLSSQYGIVLHCDKLVKDRHMTLVKQAGGELLERYRVERKRLTRTGQDELDQRPTGLRGDMVLDNDSKPS